MSELAVLRAVREGATTLEQIQGATGAAHWWIKMNVLVLMRDGRLGYNHAGLVVR